VCAHLCADRSFDEVSVLRAELARKNMYVRHTDDSVHKRGKYGGEYPPSYVSPQNPPLLGGPTPSPPGSLPLSHGRGYASVGNSKDNPPCNTLFIGNLGETVCCLSYHVLLVAAAAPCLPAAPASLLARAREGRSL
jgi:hypothetical protein